MRVFLDLRQNERKTAQMERITIILYTFAPQIIKINILNVYGKQEK